MQLYPISYSNLEIFCGEKIYKGQVPPSSISSVISRLQCSPDMMSSKPKHILVLGAGVTGLSTALSFLQSENKYAITILATHLPGDFSIDYTSPWAGGHWRSHATLVPEDERVRRWDKRTYEVWTGMLNSGGNEKELGLGFRRSRNYWSEEGGEAKGLDGSGLWWKDVVADFEVLKKEKLEGAVMGVQYKSVCFAPSVYIKQLLEKVQGLGGRILRSSVSTDAGLDGVVRSAKKLLKTQGAEDIFALVNCTGLGARHFLPKEEAEKLYPIRGQTILVKGEATGLETYMSPPGDDMPPILYVIARPSSGTTILGGCKGVGDWNAEVDDDLTKKILAGVKKYKMAESISEGGKLEVLSTQVGFRPGRKGGPRVEVEGKVADVWVVHSYGHAGGGYQASIGCAEEVTGLVEGLQ